MSKSHRLLAACSRSFASLVLSLQSDGFDERLRTALHRMQ